MSGRAKTAVFFFSFVFCGILFGIIASYVFQFFFSFSLAKAIPDNEKFFIPAKFVIYGSGYNTVSARVWLYDRNGAEIAVIERSWNGEKLFLEFDTAEFQQKIIPYPSHLYTEDSYKNGVRLDRYYNEKGLCRLYSDIGEPDKVKNAYYRLSLFALSRFPLSGGHSKKITLELSNYKTGELWSIITAVDGTVSVIVN